MNWPDWRGFLIQSSCHNDSTSVFPPNTLIKPLFFYSLCLSFPSFICSSIPGHRGTHGPLFAELVFWCFSWFPLFSARLFFWESLINIARNAERRRARPISAVILLRKYSLNANTLEYYSHSVMGFQHGIWKAWIYAFLNEGRITPAAC